MEHIHTQTGTRFTYDRTDGDYIVNATSRDGARTARLCVPNGHATVDAARAGYLFEQEFILAERTVLGL